MTEALFCCRDMRHHLEVECDDHPDRFECPDIVMHRFDSGLIGTPVRDGGDSVIKIDYCPWCGAHV